jgi:RNA polymerase sigma factor (sigma-70 family)
MGSGSAQGAVMTPEAAPAFDDFYRAEFPRLARALYLVTLDPSQAEDVAQEAMARVYERWESVGEMASPVGYLYRVALNVHRRRRRRLLRTPRQVAAAVPDPADTAERRVAIRDALRSLSPDQRAALVLVEWVGLDAAAAGTVLGISAESVRSRVHRARARLAERFGGLDD